MQSTFSGLEIGKRSLVGHQKGLNIVGHNLSNANNNAYSRQTGLIGTVDPLYRSDLTRSQQAGQIGQGMEVVSVRRVRDLHLDKRIYDEGSALSYWEKTKAHLTDLERIYAAMGEVNLQMRLDNFWKAWQELSNNPSEPAVREELVEKTHSLTRTIRKQFYSLAQLQREANEKIQQEFLAIEKISNTIGSLNQEIYASLHLGDNPNDLLDRRDALVEELSKLTEVKVNFRDNDEMMLYVGGRILVQGAKVSELQLLANPANEGFYEIRWAQSGDLLTLASGSLKAHLEQRDLYLTRELGNLDSLATNLIYEVNHIHQRGFNAYGIKAGNFFRVENPMSESNGNFDNEASGAATMTALYQITGGARLRGESPIGGSGIITLSGGVEGNELITVPYAADEKISDLLERIYLANSKVNMKLDFEGRLVVKSREGSPRYPFALASLSDSGVFLSEIAEVLAPGSAFDGAALNQVEALNPAATFERSPLRRVASWIALEENLSADSGLIATRKGTNYGPGEELPFGTKEGSIARTIAQLRFGEVLVNEARTFNEFYVEMTAGIGTEIKGASFESERTGSLTAALKEARTSISGVNLDEELAHLLALQTGYRAGAKVVQVMDELFDTLINRLG